MSCEGSWLNAGEASRSNTKKPPRIPIALPPRIDWTLVGFKNAAPDAFVGEKLESAYVQGTYHTTARAHCY
uniref:Uncharacterized protein n=1 Tax=Arundo donax TaxID=35708 RepID=A0A0A9FDA1_ARUDO